MFIVVFNKGRGKFCRGEIWVECYCGILDLGVDKWGLGKVFFFIGWEGIIVRREVL